VDASERSVVRGRDREFQQIGDGAYQLTIPSLTIQFTVDRIRRERNQLIAELAVACDLPGAHTVEGYLSVADCNLSSATARTQRAKLLAARSEAPDIDWDALVEDLAVHTIAAERHGSPAKALHEFARPTLETSATFDIDGWPWLRDHSMLTFADGGGLKSYLALYGCGVLSRRGVRIGYSDWELTGEDHLERLERLFGADLPTIYYFRCDKPLVDEADRIHRESRRLSLDYLVYDSGGFGTAGPPESAEHALAFFRATRQIGVGCHILAHINRSDNGDQKPFGSSFWHNSARATWFAKQAAASPDGQCLTVGLFNRKTNLTRRHPAIGFQFDFSDDRTAVTRVNLADVEDLAGQLPLWQRIAHLIKAGGGSPRTIAELAEKLDAKVDSVKRAVSPTRARGGKSIFAQVPGTDGLVRIALVERRVTS
jgi:hypothetical protein